MPYVQPPRRRANGATLTMTNVTVDSLAQGNQLIQRVLSDLFENTAFSSNQFDNIISYIMQNDPKYLSPPYLVPMANPPPPRR